MWRVLLLPLVALWLLCARVEATTTSTSTSSTTTTTLQFQGGSGTLANAQAATGSTPIIPLGLQRPASVTFYIDAGTGTSSLIEAAPTANGPWFGMATAVTADGVVTFQNPSGWWRVTTTVTSGAASVYFTTNIRP